MSSTRHDLSKLARLVAYRKMDRREFLSQALKAGVLATAASIFLTACRRPPVAEVAPEEPTPSFDQQALTEARYYVKMEGETIQCQLCFRRCTISEGERGYCGVRENREGTLYTLVYGRPCSITEGSPIEKLPLYHVLPGSARLNLATAGCNFKCSFCHNWQIAARTPEEVISFDLSPEEVVERAIENNLQFIAFTYTEPTVFYEYMYDVSKLAKEKGLRTLLNTNGAMNPEPLRQLLKYIDAVNVDLKAFTAEFYQVTSYSELEPVLTTLKIIKEEGVWFEITNLVIPTLNDDMGKIREMCIWVRDNLGKDVPLHFSRFFPAYKLTRLPPTPIETLEQARAIALEVGLEYVTIGNVPGHEANSTFCPNCGETLIKRVHFSVLANHIEDGKCKFCGYQIPGVWA
ncbi:pyruvate formate lyase activating enzyme [Candidatus Hakubella thermalkaliphila]|uniref:Pyruvate formate lyase activating enzyme n=3 Tax=Candidatus Hakubella thermalkaliphila TaxID=2754717 RepID=A0A6V8NEU9_9ACTN|nr:AmmeMemoRadiSam system radical SAM enzyme [Candidatus Hakubella thermalkaliphila]GFP18765.1 pyruvate formate lyase activating enzyme [Candidatus Hakubella thermalkaliphila]GFP37011.1 pyruvate formate lyase activating enzyme [Candidatus Hakubella thermalkaliphila]